MNRVSASIAHPSPSTTSRFTASTFTASTFTASRLTASRLTASRLTASGLTTFRSIASRAITSRSTSSKYSSNLNRSWPPTSVSPNTLNYCFKVHLWVHSISRSPSASLSSLDFSLQVHLETHSITHSKYIFKVRRRWYGDTRVTEVAGETGSIYSADPGVHRHHLISISSYHSMKIHTLCLPTFGLSRSIRGSMQLLRSSMPGSIIPSNLIPTLLEPEPLCLRYSLSMPREVLRSVDGGLSAL